MITVTPEDNDVFTVQVEEGGSSSEFTVTVDDDYHQKLTGNACSKQELVEKSFDFLLKREPKESILPNFNLKVIAKYFPDYEKKIGQQ